MIIISQYDVEEVYRLYDGILMRTGKAEVAVKIVEIAMQRKSAEEVAGALHNVAGTLAQLMQMAAQR